MTDALFLIDSNIAIYILNDAVSSAALRVSKHAPGSVVTSAIAFAEVMRGIPAGETKALASARRLFSIIAPLPFEAPQAQAYRQVPFRRHKFGRLIAAHALSLGLTLVTANEADFADVPGLRVENWTLPV